MLFPCYHGVWIITIPLICLLYLKKYFKMIKLLTFINDSLTDHLLSPMISVCSVYLFFSLLFSFVLCGEERQGRGKKRGRILRRLHVQDGTQSGAGSHNPEIMTGAEVKRCLTNKPFRHPLLSIFFRRAIKLCPL